MEVEAVADNNEYLTERVTMNMESKKAAELYSQTPKQYNCAQAVAVAFQRDDLLETLKSCGGGKAPGGMCGALYAAILLAPEEKRDELEQHFREQVGDILCKSIRRENRTKCVDCVRIAARLLAERET